MTTKRITAFTIMLLGFISQLTAQGYFDDKELKQPVPHKRSYNQEELTLKKIVRDIDGTILIFDFFNPWQDKGWKTSFDYAECLIDPVTGTKYPLIYSEGIPKEPEVYRFPEAGEQRQTARLVYAPIPREVKTLQTPLGFYDIDISGLNINNSESIRQWFPTNLNADKGQLEVIAVTADSEHVLLWFKYTTPDGYKSYKPSINPDTHLLDPATGKAYKAVSAKGLPVSPEYLPMSGNKTVGFAIQFESPLKDGVKTFNYVWSPKSTWNINGITLD